MNRRLFSVCCLIFFASFAFADRAFAQIIPCDGLLRSTRQLTGTNTVISTVRFIPGSATISNLDTLTPNVGTNASVYYNGYIWTQDWGPSTFTLLKVNGSGGYTSYPMASIGAIGDLNNAAVTDTGTMLVMSGTSLYAIDLRPGTGPVLVSGFPKTITFSPTATNGTAGPNWGDIAADPTNNDLYAWWHPTDGTNQSYRGLYKITGVNTASPIFTKVNGAAGAVNQTMGSLFFNDKGQLFGYGSTTLGGAQDRLWAIDKVTGKVTQYGAPDISVSQSDGCSCPFRISLEKYSDKPVLNVNRCASDTFSFIFRTRKYSAAAATNIGLGDTLDARLSFAVSASALQSTLQALYGGSVAVAIGNHGSGTNNRLAVTGMTIPSGTATFSVPVSLSAGAFSGTNFLKGQAWLNGIATDLGGPAEASDNPFTFDLKDSTAVTINIAGNACMPPVANNYTHAPLLNTAGAQAVPGLVASDADGTVSSFTVTTVPASGTMAYCSNGSLPCGGSFVTLTANTTLTPAQASSLRYTPDTAFTGGNVSFFFTATDNHGNVSNSARYVIPVYNTAPLATNILMDPVVSGTADTTAASLQAADNKRVASYTVHSLPSSGTLRYCSNGTAPCTGTLSAVSAGLSLTQSQAASLRYTPPAYGAASYTFKYTATDNNSAVSDTALYTIPVVASTSTVRPPIAENIVSQVLNPAQAAVVIPALKATDADSSISSYTILTLPDAAAGVLYVAGNPATLNQTLTTTEAAQLTFDPAANYSGTGTSYTYRATDNSALQSGAATYRIPIRNIPPTAINVSYQVPAGVSGAVLPIMGAADADGSISSITITSVPAQGTLQICTPTCTTVSAPLTVMPANWSALRFTPAAGSPSTLSFRMVATDNNGVVSDTGVYTLVVTDAAPRAADVLNTALANSAAATTMGTLSASDSNGGVITGYIIRSLPDTVAGALRLSGTAVTVGQVISTAQASSLTFDPAANYTGIASFTFTATDNGGNTSNLAQATIPVTGVGNLPPISENKHQAVIPVAAGATALPALSAIDPEASTIASFRIETVPPTYAGTFTYCTTGALPGCIGTAITGPIDLTAAQAATLRFDPTGSFVGTVQITYTATDTVGATGNAAAVFIPIGGTPPTAQPVVATAIANNAGLTALTSFPLSATDADGTMASYRILTVPTSTQGTLALSGVAVTVGQVIPAASAANLQFTPTLGFRGNAIFNYDALDNHSLRSNTAVYTIPVTGVPPRAADINNAPVYDLAPSAAINALSATDADGTVASYSVQSLPAATQGTVLLNTTPLVVGQSLTPSQMAQLFFDPAGSFTGFVQWNYDVVDNTGLVSNLATVNIPVRSAPLSGNVLHDFDGLVDNTVDGTATTAGTTLYANLVDATGKVMSVTTVVGGSYAFPRTPVGAFTLVLSTTQGSLGAAPPTAALPSSWVAVGENLGTSAGNDGAVNGTLSIAAQTGAVMNANFGIERKATADAKSFSLNNSGGAVSIVTVANTLSGGGTFGNRIRMSGTSSSGSVPGQLTGTDPDGGNLSSVAMAHGTSLRFQIDPSSYVARNNVGATIANGAVLEYNGVQLHAGGCQGGNVGNVLCSSWNSATARWEIPNYDSSKLTILAKPGVKTLSFRYGWKDSAAVSGDSVTYGMSFSTPLTLTLESFEAEAQGCDAVVAWTVPATSTAARFIVERSADGRVFETAAALLAIQGQRDYHVRILQVRAAEMLYRVAVEGRDGHRMYSASASVNAKCDGSVANWRLLPNPVRSGAAAYARLVVSAKGTLRIRVMNLQGQVVATRMMDVGAGAKDAQLPTDGLAAGVYLVAIADEAGAAIGQPQRLIVE